MWDIAGDKFVSLDENEILKVVILSLDENEILKVVNLSTLHAFQSNLC